ncbi:MAG: redox-regulated ATPase YchF, partial [Thermoproteota archaeon]
KPNVGKSTFFAAATLIPVKIANYPFTTIEPNVGIGYVRIEEVSEEFNVKPEPNNSFIRGRYRFVPVQLVDLPGLVPGAHEGRGLGNQFLTEVSTADALLHIIDASGGTDEEGRPVKPGSYDVLKDIKFLEEEYIMWQVEVLKKNWEKVIRKQEIQKLNLAEAIFSTISNLAKSESIVKEIISSSKLPEVAKSWKEEEFLSFSRLLMKLTKPTLIIANKVDVPEAEDNIKRLNKEGYSVIPASAEAELALKRADKLGIVEYVAGEGSFKIKEGSSIKETQLRALNFIKEKVLEKWGNTGVQQALEHAAFKLLGMVAVYPVADPRKLTDSKGRVLPDVYLMNKDSTVRDLAFAIHSEIGKNFLYAIDARKMVRLSDDYKLKHLDVISIVSATK